MGLLPLIFSLTFMTFPCRNSLSFTGRLVFCFVLTNTHTTTFKFCRRAHLLDKLLMSKINLHISSNFFKLLCIGKRCFQPEVAKSSHIMCFINWAPMLVQIFPWTGVSDYQKLHLLAPATADKFLIEKHMNKLIWRNLWMMLYGYAYNRYCLFFSSLDVYKCWMGRSIGRANQRGWLWGRRSWDWKGWKLRQLWTWNRLSTFIPRHKLPHHYKHVYCCDPRKLFSGKTSHLPIKNLASS